MKKLIASLLTLALCLSLALPVMAAEGAEHEVWTTEDLMKISEDPTGTYRLMRNIDMSGVEWPCPAFSGTLHGDGYALLNLRITAPGDTFEFVNEAEQKIPCRGAGLFSVCQDAVIENVRLLGLHGEVVSDECTFLGGLAGAAFHTTVTGCEVSGYLELDCGQSVMGLGGIMGYGSGTISECRLNLNLVAADTGDERLDDMYFGGVTGFGYADIQNNTLALNGYFSQHGYVHGGGLIGFAMQYPLASGISAALKDNRLDGSFTYFEDADRRKFECQEILGGKNKCWGLSVFENSSTLKITELREFDAVLRPETCAEPVYDETTVEPLCDSMGYTQYRCLGCGYSFVGSYVPEEHQVAAWEPAQIPGFVKGECVICRKEVLQLESEIPEPEPTEEVTEPEEVLPTVPQTQVLEQTEHDFTYYLAWVFLAIAVCIPVGLVVMFARHPARRRETEEYDIR